MITITSSNKQYTGRMSYKARVKLARLGYKVLSFSGTMHWRYPHLIELLHNKYGY